MTQYVTAVAGRGALYHELQELFDADYPISTLHHFLATLPGMLREKGHSPRGQIILTTNYDDVLEKAFEQAGEPFDLLSYSSEEQRSCMFIHTPPGGNWCVIENPNYYHDLRSKERTVIIKISGSVNRSDPSVGQLCYH